jgi:uncharacterized membrane protein
MENQNQQQPQQPQPPVEQKANSTDAEKNKLMAIIGYIIPVLFFIPLVSDAKNSPFAKFHANQQLNFLLFLVLGYVISSALMIVLIGFLLYFLVLIGNVVFLVLGIINAAKGEMKKLPLIGGFEIIK